MIIFHVSTLPNLIMHLCICKYICIYVLKLPWIWFEILSFILCVQGSVRVTATPTPRPTRTPGVYTAAQWWTPTAWSSMAAVWGKYLVSLVSNGYFSLNIKYKKQKSSTFYNVLVLVIFEVKTSLNHDP